MANHEDIVPFFYKWEGGLSRDKSDSASKKTCPVLINGVGGYHTNKGITYETWCGAFGEDQAQRFIDMTDCDWGLIFKTKYWDKVKGDKVKSQAIANTLVSWAWGSGANRAIKLIQGVVGVKVDGIIGSQTLSAINNYNEKELFELCLKRREKFFRDICEIRPKNKKFLKGWLNRLNNFAKLYRP